MNIAPEAIAIHKQNLQFLVWGRGVMGIMVGVVGISWFKHQCLPDEYKDMREREKERTELDVERQPSETDF